MSTTVVSTVVALQTPGYIYNLVANNNVSFPDTRIDFSSGAAWVYDNLVQFDTSITKRLDQPWAPGTNNGGLFLGTAAPNTWYHCFAMQNSITRAVDFGFDTSISASNTPPGWNCTLIWSILTDASGKILPFQQVGSKCIWGTPILDYTGPVNPSGQLVSLSSPAALKAEVEILTTYTSSNGSYFYLLSPTQSPPLIGGVTGGIPNTTDFSVKTVNTDTNSQVKIVSVGGGADTLRLVTNGWWHPARGYKVGSGPQSISTTDQLAEGLTNFYFSNGRARLALSANVPVNYNSLTGNISIPPATTTQDGYIRAVDFQAFTNKQSSSPTLQSIIDGFLSAGNGFFIRKKLDGSGLEFTNAPTGGGGGGSNTAVYRNTFTNANLTNGILTVTHGLNLSSVGYFIWDNTSKQIYPDDITLIDSNNLLVNLTSFSNPSLSGTWQIFVFG
jgi:hypothetical protein